MICVAQIACFIWGIVTIVKANIKLGSKNITGGWARIIGAAMTAWLPTSMGTGLVMGLVIAMNNPGLPENQLMQKIYQLWWVDIVLAVFCVALICVMAAMAKDSQLPSPTMQQPFNNPYQQPPARPPSDNPYEPPNRS